MCHTCGRFDHYIESCLYKGKGSFWNGGQNNENDVAFMSLSHAAEFVRNNSNNGEGPWTNGSEDARPRKNLSGGRTQRMWEVVICGPSGRCSGAIRGLWVRTSPKSNEAPPVGPEPKEKG